MYNFASGVKLCLKFEHNVANFYEIDCFLLHATA